MRRSRSCSPAAAALEEIAARWALSVLSLPPQCAVRFTTGATMANLAAPAAAHAVLERAGWNVEEQGLAGAPPVCIVVGDEVHVSVLKALSLLGFGRARLLRVPVDSQGRMRAEHLPALDGPAIVCAQAGNVNTGAFDPLRAICERAHASGAWVHVDGAFGLWALASPAYAHLAEGAALADSWATDAHKWLNVTYDCGLAIVRNPAPCAPPWHPARPTSPPAACATGRRSFRSCRAARGVEVWARCARWAARVAGSLSAAAQLACRFADSARGRRSRC